ncbi:hypothetical protein AB0J82_36735 [Asanoa sp. NPDC049518]|uniref:hypothetical protein n=1 Tax=unclassified Asanoa TaxID=2685164 RepID=UPI00341673C4
MPIDRPPEPPVQYPAVTVALSGTDGNAHALIGRVAAALRDQESPEAADAFTADAVACNSYDALLTLIIRTVTAS